MALNFLGLGFSFGAKDTGLGSFLDGLDQRFSQVTQTLRGLYSTADHAPRAPSMGMPQSGGMMGGGMFGSATEAATLAQKAISSVGSAVREGGDMLKSGAFAATGALGRVAGAAGVVGMAVGPMVTGFGQALSSVQNFATRIGTFLPQMVQRGIQGIQRMNQGINLTNELEGEAAGLSVTARALGANMGYTGEQLSRFTRRAAGMASGLNMGAEETARAIRAFDEAGTELRALGFEGARDVARFTAAFGVNADVLRNSTMQMTREFGMTTAQVRQVMSATVAYGQASGDVAGALNGMGEIVGHLRQQAALMGDSLDSAELARHAASAQALATGFFQMGQDSDQARTSAMALASSMLGARQEFQNMFAGTQDELPNFARQIAIATGDVEQAFNSMRQGPAQFVSGMANLVRRTRENRGDVGRLLEFMRARLQETVGPEQASQLVNFFRGATPEILRMMEATQNASRNLGQMGREAHRTGRTLQDTFERSLQGAQTALRGVTRRETVRFVRDTGREMRRLGQAFRSIGEQEGPMGGIVRLMSRTAQMGQLGLVPERFRATAVMANQIHTNMQPLINSLTSFGGLVDAAATQAILFGTRVAQNMRVARDEMGSTASQSAVLRRAFDITANEFADEWINSIDTFERYITMALDAFANIDWVNLFTPSDRETNESASGAMGAFQRVLNRLRSVDWSGLWANLSRGASRLWEFLQPHMQRVWNDFRRFILSELDDVWQGVVRAWRAWWQQNWQAVAAWTAVIFTAIMVAAMLTALAALALIVVATVVASILAPFLLIGAPLVAAWYMWGDQIAAGLRRLGAWFVDQWNGITTWFRTTWERLQAWWTGDVVGGIQRAWDGLWNAARMKVERTIQGIRSRFPRMSQAFDTMVGAATRAWNAMWQNIIERVTNGRDWLIGAWSSIRDSATSAFSGIGDYFAGIWQGVQAQVTAVATTISSLWTTITTNVQGALTSIAQALAPLREAIGAIGSFFTDIWRNVGTVIQDVVRRITGFFDNLGAAGMNNLTRIFSVVERLFGRSMNTIIARDVDRSTDEFDRLSNQGQRALHAVFGVAQDLFGHSINSVIGEGFAADVHAVADVASDPSAAARRDQALNQTSLVRATHYPEWYTNDFKRLYMASMRELISTVRSTSAHEQAHQERHRGRGRRAADTRSVPRGLVQMAATPGGLRA